MHVLALVLLVPLALTTHPDTISEDAFFVRTSAEMATDARRHVLVLADLEAEMQELLDDIVSATGVQGLSIDLRISESEEINAGASSIGSFNFIMVNEGLIKWLVKISISDIRSDAGKIDIEAASERASHLLSAVLAHEVAHITLGHKGGYTTQLAEEQDREIDADRHGALYLVRAGGEIQSMIDLQRHFRALTESEGFAGSSYLSTHPPAIVRESNLESFRAALRILQVTYDDARKMILANVRLDNAIAKLDTILNVLPGYIAARHLRGVAYHQRWLNSAPTSVLQVQVSLPTYRAKLADAIRDPGTSAVPVDDLVRAQSEYTEVLSRGYRPPYTISNLAVVNAYLRQETARSLMAESLRTASEDPHVINNAGVVLYLAGSLDTASTLFAIAIKRFAAGPHSSRGGYMKSLFNLGRSKSELNAAEGPRLLGRYIELDQGTTWKAEALAILEELGVMPPSVSLEPAPSGVRLGDEFNDVRNSLGEPTAATESGEYIEYTYLERGLVIGVSPTGTVTSLRLEQPWAGSVGGVRVGDSAADASQLLGNPSHEGSGTLVFTIEDFSLAVERPEGTVEALTVYADPSGQ